MTQDRPTALMLKQICFFQDMEEAELESTVQDMWIEHLRRGHPLGGRKPGQESPFLDTAYFVFRGVVALYSETLRGRRKILFFQGPGRLLNLNVMASCGDSHYGEAAADAILLCMERRRLEEMVRGEPRLAAALLAHYETKLWRLSHQLKNSAGVMFAERKLAGKLLKLASDFGKDREAGRVIPFDLTITQMADYIGIPRETVSRAAGKLTELGLISYENRRFCIPDVKALERFRRQAD